MLTAKKSFRKVRVIVGLLCLALILLKTSCFFHPNPVSPPAPTLPAGIPPTFPAASGATIPFSERLA
jgi:hypothetical protein